MRYSVHCCLRVSSTGLGDTNSQRLALGDGFQLDFSSSTESVINRNVVVSSLKKIGRITTILASYRVKLDLFRHVFLKSWLPLRRKSYLVRRE
jgi:hypothetical protein